MFRIVYGGFRQETNTFSPLICKRENFIAGGITKGDEVISVLRAHNDHPASMLHVLLEAPDVEVIPGADFHAASYGRVDQTVCEEFISDMIQTIRNNQPVDAVFLGLHGGMCLTEEDDGIGLILEEIRKELGPDKPIVACTDLHANITHKVMENLDILTGFHEYPHTDKWETGWRASELGLAMMRSGERPHMACAKIPMILQAEACTTKSGPLKELIEYADGLQRDGKCMDYSIYHLQPWLDCKEAGASVVVIAKTAEQAKSVADELAARFFALRHVLQYKPMSLDEGLDLAVNRPKDGEIIVLSDAADNTSGGATGDSVVVLRRILERKLDIRAACVVADPEAVEYAISLGVGATAEFMVGGKLDPARQKPVTFTGTVISIPDPVVEGDREASKGTRVSFGKVAIVRTRNTDVVICVYPQWNTSPRQFTGFGLDMNDYDMILVKSALHYKESCRYLTSQLYNIDTPGSTTSNLISLGFEKIPRPTFPFDDTDDFGPAPAYEGRTRDKQEV